MQGLFQEKEDQRQTKIQSDIEGDLKMKNEAKFKMDEEVIFLNRKSEIEQSIERLKKAGNLEEAALVVSYEGMKILENIIGNTIKEVVNETVDQKMRSVLSGIMKGMINSVLGEDQKETVSETIKEAVEEKGEETNQNVVNLKPSPQEKFEKKVKDYRKKKDEKPKKNLIRWSVEEDQYIIDQMNEKKDEGLSDNKALDHIQIKGRTTSSIKYRWFTILSKRQNKVEEVESEVSTSEIQ